MPFKDLPPYDELEKTPLVWVVEQKRFGDNPWQFFCLFETQEYAKEYIELYASRNKEFRFGPYVVHKHSDLE